jgi:hypothetical protein
MEDFIQEVQFNGVQKMTLIRYYNLESTSWEVVSDLGRDLQKHLLSETRVRGLLETLVEKSAEAKLGNGDVETIAKLLYDPGEFSVLYSNSWMISKGKRKLFRKNIPPRYGANLVVSGSPADILQTEEYLTNSSIEIVQLFNAKKLTIEFGTHYYNDKDNNYKKLIRELVHQKCPRATVNYKTDRMFDGVSSNYSFSGIIEGPIEDVFRMRSAFLGHKEMMGIKYVTVERFSA